MRIEELILDGFKSYPVRTTITGWDPSFNAITGLNGSGKSNILDAICFVLGITNMTQVRANNLMDLIYKRGQAAVTKASVTIVFDNSDKTRSPIGFEASKQITVTRQIAVGGVSKYLLNGHKCTLQKLQETFQSVQLNINNPNFLIMQGKITKVLNMKPAEILGMIEEASGTRMFEERKEKAVKTMAKKDKKVEEIASLLREEVDPQLEKLREEKRAYLAYQKTISELERLTRLVKAYEWSLAVEKAKKAAEDVKQRQNQEAEGKREVVKFGEELKGMEKDVREIEKKREKELAKGGKVQALQDKVNELDREVTKLKAQLEMDEGNLTDEQKRAAATQKNVQELERGVRVKRKEHDEDVAAFAGIKQEYDTSITEIAKAEELLQTLLTGLSANSSGEGEAAGGYMGQLAEAKARVAAAGTEAEQAKVTIGITEKELKEKEPRAKKASKDGEGGLQKLESEKKKLEQVNAKLAKLDWDEEKEQGLSQRRADLEEKIATLSEKRDTLRSRLAAIDFSYSDPYPNFDRSQVKGLVANLIDLDPAMYKNATALEICAGGKLYNVVVEDEQVGSALLDKGKLRKRVTIIPLSKISAFKMSAEKLATAESLAPGKVNLALSLIGYDEDVSAAMAYVFGDMLVCQDKETAQKVTFNKAVGVKSVTLEGDVYDPSGTLSGGAAPSSSGIIIKVQEVNKLEKDIQSAQVELDDVLKNLNQAKASIEAYRKVKKEADLKQHEISLLEQEVQSSNGAKLVLEVNGLKTEIRRLKEVMSEAKTKEKAAQDECKRLEKEIKDFKNNKDSKLKEIKADIANRKKALNRDTAQVKSRQKELQTAELEIEQLDTDLEAARADATEAEASCRKMTQELESAKANIGEMEAHFAKAEAKLKSERAVLTAFDDELADLERDIKSKKQDISDAELSLQKLGHEISTLAKEETAANGLTRDLENQFTWIKDEKKLFGKVGSRYDFQGVNLPQIRKQCAELETQQKSASRKVNNKVMSMIDSIEKKEAALKKNMATVLKDKSKIESTILELDRYKLEALTKTWKQVNEDFGAIFAELLPSNFAKLEPPEGQTVDQGLEVKVRIGSVWKQSLTELSGGQRSLIALSLMMAILQTRPSPLYIFDEIDSAMDMSHTSKMGQLFGKRFKGAQFIVVSLKEGLFSGANVLFQAKFRDGTSIVERTAARSVQSIQADKENVNANRRGRPALTA